MTDSFVRRNTADEDKKLDAEQLIIGGLQVYRERGTSVPEAFSKRLDYDANGNVIYYGRAVPGSATSDSVWSVMKLAYDVSGNLLSVQWAGGTKAPAFSWDGRTGHVYS